MEITPKPCPFCKRVDVTVVEGSTFRWRIVVCNFCGASCGEVRHNTMAKDQKAEEEVTRVKALIEWNTRDGVPPPEATS